MRRRGFAIAELVAVVLVILLVIALAIPVARRARLAGGDAVDAENLHRFAGATTAYAADNRDRYWTFSWRKASFEGEALPTEYEDLKNRNGSDHEAAVAQAIDILRRKAGREDVNFINSWFPHLYYSQLPLYDYLDQEMPALWGISPADRHRLDWAQDPEGFDKGKFLPCQPTPGPANKRWPYSSSYQLPPAFYDHSPIGQRISQTEGGFSLPAGAVLSPYGLGEVQFPSQKVHIYATAEYHLGEGTGDGCDLPADSVRPESRAAILFGDGHTGWMRTADANAGWQPNNPNSPEPTYIGEYPGRYRWTRNGIFGRDFGGPEVGPP